MTSPGGEIPQSPALSEATPDSLAELMSRDPEGFSQQDLARVVAALRAQRARQELANKQAAADGSTKRLAGASRKALPAPSATSASAEELDL